MVAKCLLTGASIHLREDELQHCPFACLDDELFIAYFAPAKSSCFAALGWPRPQHMLDLYVEFRCLTNGRLPKVKSSGKGKRKTRHALINAMTYFGLSTLGSEEKDEMRDLAIRGPRTAQEWQDLLVYCETDVDALALLLPKLLEFGQYSSQDLQRALLRGLFMVMAGFIETRGIPIDVKLLNRLLDHWDDIKLRLVDAIDEDYGVYTGSNFNVPLFEDYLERHGIPWPRLESGELALNDKVFREMMGIYPQLGPLRELRHILSQFNLNDLAVGDDGRARAMLSPFGATTGRCTPSSSQFIFGTSVWLRSLIQPEPGYAIAYLDWSAQEIAIAAALSGDENLWQTYDSGDPYIHFARLAGLVPPDATKRSHPRERALCKVLFLGVNYGMTANGLARRTGLHIMEARHLLQLHKQAYPVFWKWVSDNVNCARLGIALRTTYGWQFLSPPRPGRELNLRSIQNFGMQANGSEMLRMAVIMAMEAGVEVIAPVHDALMIQAPIDEIEAVVARTIEIMGDASELVLGAGKRCRVNCDGGTIGHPDRYADERGSVTFQKVVKLLGEIEESKSLLKIESRETPGKVAQLGD